MIQHPKLHLDRFSRFGATVCKRFALRYRTVVLSVYLSVTLVYCGQTVGTDQDEIWHGGRSQPQPQYARWGPSPH